MIFTYIGLCASIALFLLSTGLQIAAARRMREAKENYQRAEQNYRGALLEIPTTDGRFGPNSRVEIEISNAYRYYIELGGHLPYSEFKVAYLAERPSVVPADLPATGVEPI